MARSIRSSVLETRATRLRLGVARKLIFVKIGPSVGLGYRRNRTAGTWVVWVGDGQGGNWTRAIGAADDFDEADGSTYLNFWQAQEKARALARAGRVSKARCGDRRRWGKHSIATKPTSSLAEPTRAT